MRGCPRDLLSLAPALVVLLAFAGLAVAMFEGSGCGARSAIPASSEGGAGGAPACVKTGTAPATAGIGGPLESQVTDCFERPSSGVCPSVDDAEPLITPKCGLQIVSVDCGPIVDGSMCCYRVTEVCGYA